MPISTEEAHSFCMMGAVHRAIVGVRDTTQKLSEDERALYFGARDRIHAAMGTREHPVLWNDVPRPHARRSARRYAPGKGGHMSDRPVKYSPIYGSARRPWPGLLILGPSRMAM